MGLISSQVTVKEDRVMADQKIQKDDLVETNNVGQDVVIAPAGQPAPDDDELARRRKAAGVTVNGTDDQVDAARNVEGGHSTVAPNVEDKARRSSRGK
jgi:hypothetical protein